MALGLGIKHQDSGFWDCSIIYNQNPLKYWVVLKIYNKKIDAYFDRERFLLDGWIKKM